MIETLTIAELVGLFGIVFSACYALRLLVRIANSAT